MKLNDIFIGYANVITPFGEGMKTNIDAILAGKSAYGLIPKDHFGPDFPEMCVGFINHPFFNCQSSSLKSKAEQLLDWLIQSTLIKNNFKKQIDAVFMLYRDSGDDQESVQKIFASHAIAIDEKNIFFIENTCTSGLALLTYAAQGINTGIWNNVLVCAIDLIQPFDLYLLNNLGAIAPTATPPEHSLRPFDRNRKGFVKSESATMALLSNNKNDLQNTELMKLISFHRSSDASKLTDGREDCHYLSLAMKNALQDSMLAPSNIAFVKTHGIGSEQGDLYEAKAIDELFKQVKTPITSLKGHLGHTGDASALLESVIAAQALSDSLILPIKNCDQPDFNLNFITNSPIQTNLKYFLSNAIGFGGYNSSAVFQVL